MSVNKAIKILSRNQIHYNNALDLLRIVRKKDKYCDTIREAADRVADYLLNGR